VVRDSIMRALRGFERLLLLLGLLLVFAYAVVRIYSVVYAHATVREFGAIRKPPSTGPATSFSRISGSRIFGFGRPNALKPIKPA
jgi:hypothetical protein